MKKFQSLILTAALAIPTAALACNPSALLEGGGGSVNYKSSLDGGSNCFFYNSLIDASGAQLFPNVAALADASATPTTARIGSLITGYNGTTWDFLRTVGTGVLKTDSSTIAGTAAATGHGVSGAGVQRVELPTDGTGTVGLIAGSALVGKVGIDQTTPGTTNGVQINAGTAVIGKAGIDQTTPGTTNAVQAIPGTTGGNSVCYLAAAASTNATNCKASAGQAFLYHLENTTSAIYYLRMYNLAASPTCSSATGYVESIPIPAGATGSGVGGIVIPQDLGEAFSTGIGFCVTGGAGNTDSTNAAVGVFVRILYK